MESIARVVGDEQDGAFVGRDGGNCCKDLLYGGAGEDVAASYGRKKAIANIAGPGGLVTATTTRD